MGQSNAHKGHRARLKEEFLARGLDGWSDHKILELLLCYAIPQGDVNPLAHELIERFWDLSGVLDADISDLKAVKGMGEHSAILLKLLPGICACYLSQISGDYSEAEQERNWDYTKVLYRHFIGATREKCCVLSLDSRQKILGVDEIAEGQVTAVQFNQRRVLEVAIRHNAAAIILAHNHVGAHALPSRADTYATKEMRNLLQKVGIELLDHLIFNGKDFVSLRDSGLLL